MYARHGIIELILKALAAWISLWIRGSVSRQSLFLYILLNKNRNKISKCMIDSLVCMIVREKRPEERPGGFKLTLK